MMRRSIDGFMPSPSARTARSAAESYASVGISASRIIAEAASAGLATGATSCYGRTTNLTIGVVDADNGAGVGGLMDANAVICRRLDTVTTNDPPPSNLAHAETTAAHIDPPSSRGKGRLAVLWGISGSVLSALGFLGITLFQMYNDSLNELRRDLKHFNESSADLVKKDSLQRMRDLLRDCHKELQAAAVARAQIEHSLQASEKERREMFGEMQHMRERLANVEGRQAATPILVPMAAATEK
jgi:hypothetical protein